MEGLLIGHDLGMFMNKCELCTKWSRTNGNPPVHHSTCTRPHENANNVVRELQCSARPWVGSRSAGDIFRQGNELHTVGHGTSTLYNLCYD